MCTTSDVYLTVWQPIWQTLASGTMVDYLQFASAACFVGDWPRIASLWYRKLSTSWLRPATETEKYVSNNIEYVPSSVLRLNLRITSRPYPIKIYSCITPCITPSHLPWDDELEMFIITYSCSNTQNNNTRKSLDWDWLGISVRKRRNKSTAQLYQWYAKNTSQCIRIQLYVPRSGWIVHKFQRNFSDAIHENSV